VIARLDPGAVVDLDWSPDGSKIAITRAPAAPMGDAAAIVMPARAGRHDGEPGLAVRSLRVEVVGLDGGVIWEIPPGLGDAWSPRWSPTDGRISFILFNGNAGRDTNASYGPSLWVADGTAAARPVGGAGPVAAFAWGPSGTDVAYLGPRAPYPADIDLRLFRCAADGTGEPTELAAGWDRSLGSTVRSDDARGTGPPVLLWSAATGRIYFTVADGGEGRLGWADAAGAGHGYLLSGRRACLDPSLDPSGEIIAFVSSDPARPGDVHLTGTDGTGERRVTDVNQVDSRVLIMVGPDRITGRTHVR
jgi:dipeptidyl aminopeptidase/acylaminoacyl peptidase